MYEAFFGLQRRPFAPVPSLEEYYPGASIEAARQTVVRCIDRAEGPAMVVGPSGTGKTLLCQSIAQHFHDDFNVVLLTSGGLSTRRALFQAILYGLARPYRGMDEGELRLALADFLTSDKSHPAGMLLVVDEAHTLPFRLLDEIRMLTNLVYEGKVRTRLVLAGGPALEERFASPKLASFSQRLAARCYLEGFSRAETEDYVRELVSRAGGDGERLFPADARAAVYQATDGIPRLINQLCDHALVLAFAAGKPRVERATVEEAWADLQQLPAPWNAETRTAQPASGVIEFGGLKDDAATEGALGASIPSPAGDPAAALDEETLSAFSAAAEGDSLPETSPADTLEPHPDAQLDRIQKLVGQLEDDFQPAGSIKPEVELIFDDPGSPLCEQFQEEEVISHPGSQATVTNRPAQGGSEKVGPAPSDFWAEPGGQRQPSSPPKIDLGVSMPRAAEHLRTPGPTPEDDPPEIVVEDWGDDFEWVGRHRILPVRRHQYRQLFTRLRYG